MQSEAATFKALKSFINRDTDRHAAIQAIQRIPLAHWPKEEARPMLEDLTTYVKKIPVKDRTTPVVLDALQLADSLASLLPLADARQVRKELGELGVRMVHVGTVPDQMLFDKDRIVALMR